MSDFPGPVTATRTVTAFGAALFLLAFVHHATELRRVGTAVGPILALVLDGLPALGLVVGGRRLGRTGLSAADRWSVATWCFVGAILFACVVGVSILVKLLEGRPVTEPEFTVLLAVEVGAGAGLVSGYFRTRAVADARDARRASTGIAFVNEIIRHDLRNDLQVIDSHATLLSADAPDGVVDSAATIREKAAEATDRIAVTETIAETMSGDPELERVDLTAVVAEIAARVERAYPVTVTTDLPETAFVRANAALRPVVDNLLENAAEHNDALDPEVQVSVTVGDDCARLAVSDNGPGLPPALRRSLDAGEPVETDGGLRIAQTLVRQFDGQLHTGDGTGSGARLVVELPLAP